MDSKDYSAGFAVFIGLLSLVAFGITIYANVLSIKVNRKALGK